MNWKIVECYLAIIIGIVVLACIDYDTFETFTMRCIVIAVLFSLLIFMPYINHRYLHFKRKMETIEEENKKQAENFQRDLKSMQRTVSEMRQCIEELEKKQEKKENPSAENTDIADDELQLFHDSMLVQWARANKMPVSDFDKVKSEYKRLRKLNININRKA
ncbi:hypothetical protein [Xylanibacter muris]|uniref:Uncharacterized protein n=1 Tax=Xylanibacter muris TaxID=2736290 RepID=A0ABX2ANF3_9BACT|nr:hypothetical protein [Xylanibacter muris]NPD92733.1 hypothetical protein [Xylanibacter muris]